MSTLNLPDLPLKLQRQLRDVGVYDYDQLRNIGVVEAFLLIQKYQFIALETQDLYQMQSSIEPACRKNLTTRCKLRLLNELEQKDPLS